MIDMIVAVWDGGVAVVQHLQTYWRAYLVILGSVLVTDWCNEHANGRQRRRDTSHESGDYGGDY